MLKFKVHTQQQKEQLHELVQAGYIYLWETYTVPNDYPKYFIFLPSETRVQGVSKGLFNIFEEAQELTFMEFCKELVNNGVVYE